MQPRVGRSSNHTKGICASTYLLLSVYEWHMWQADLHGLAEAVTECLVIYPNASVSQRLGHQPSD